MPNHAYQRSRGRADAAQSTPKGTGAPEASSATARRLTPNQTEGVILRIAGIFSADLASHPQARNGHTAYISGAIALALALGELSDRRALEVRQACLDLFDGARRPAPSRRGTPDPGFASLVAAVRRHGGASLNEPLAMAEMPAGTAALMLGRLIAAGVVDNGDVTGYHRVAKGDC